MKQLSIGQFFGEAQRRCECAGTVATTLVHRGARRLPCHVHAAPYFSLLVRGRYREEIGRHTIEHTPMTLVFHPPEMRHRDEIADDGATFFTLELSEAWLKECGLPSPSTSQGRMLAGGAPWIALVSFSRLVDGTLTALELESVVLELAADALDARDSPLNPPWLEKIEERLREEDAASVTALAAEAGVHPVHLARTFRRRYGMTLGAYALERRLDRARVLLAGDLSLADVAAQLGFADQSHFTRVFKRRTGGTPGYARMLLRV